MEMNEYIVGVVQHILYLRHGYLKADIHHLHNVNRRVQAMHGKDVMFFLEHQQETVFAKVHLVQLVINNVYFLCKKIPVLGIFYF